MASSYQPSETIKNVINKIGSREWILPGIQRRFVWNTDRIIDLFDSLMQGYPFGTLMVWKVDKKETIEKIKFYDFLQDYQEYWRETCGDYKPTNKEVYSVIDGQQRLNSLYIGLRGSYAEKLPRKKWRNAYDESIQPKMYLYINLCEHDTDEDNDREYKFAFLSDSAFNGLEDKNHWYKVANLLDDFDYYDESRLDDDEFLDKLSNIIEGLQIEKEFEREANRTLKKLYTRVFIKPIINYYLEEDNDLDRVVNIFVRTNSGGVPLAFSDLVMSVIVARQSAARNRIDELVNLIRAETGISISRDFVLKTFLYLHSTDIKFRTSNFTPEMIDLLMEKLESIGNHIKSVTIFARQIGLNDEAIRAKYALLPLLYYSYTRNIYLDNLAKNPYDRKACGVFLKISLLKGLFGGSPDSVLLPIRNEINKSCSAFPYNEIVTSFVGRNKNLSFTDEDIELRIKESAWGSPDTRIILSIITEVNPQFTYDHVDHLYPKAMFKESELNKMAFLKNDQELKNFYSNKNNWNTLGNLQLLNSAENESKNNERLSSWLSRKPEYKTSILLPLDDDGNEIYGDDQFKDFVERRRKLLAQKLKEKITL